MHSSRMRTVRNSSRLRRGGVPGPGGVPCPGWCIWSGGVPGPGGVYLVPGSVPGPGGCVHLVPGGVPGPRGYLPRYSPPWTDTHVYKHNLRNFVADGNEEDFIRDSLNVQRENTIIGRSKFILIQVVHH